MRVIVGNSRASADLCVSKGLRRALSGGVLCGVNRRIICCRSALIFPLTFAKGFDKRLLGLGMLRGWFRFVLRKSVLNCSLPLVYYGGSLISAGTFSSLGRIRIRGK